MKYNIQEVKEFLYAPVILDILDDLGYTNQGMDHGIRPLFDNAKGVKKIFGRALTVLACEVFEVPEFPYKLEFEALDTMNEGDILVATTLGHMSSAFFGELLATRCIYMKAVGAIIDGATRDIRAINKMGFPTFCRGVSPYDSKGRLDVMRYRVPIKCGGVLVKQGDLLYADMEGIAVIPKGMEEKVIKLALEKIKTEKIVRDKLASGTTAKDVYEKYGVL